MMKTLVWAMPLVTMMACGGGGDPTDEPTGMDPTGMPTNGLPTADPPTVMPGPTLGAGALDCTGGGSAVYTIASPPDGTYTITVQTVDPMTYFDPVLDVYSMPTLPTGPAGPLELPDATFLDSNDDGVLCAFDAMGPTMEGDLIRCPQLEFDVAAAPNLVLDIFAFSSTGCASDIGEFTVTVAGPATMATFAYNADPPAPAL